ncbi:MAG: nicotinamide mononucleotide transporter [Saprospiraceae bacterium]|nr:nicotinamide mononucleotide transporter [Saprospiraceae bacterium]
MHTVWQQFLDGLYGTTALEFIAVIFGILSVIYSRAENILVYPTGLVNTILYIYLSLVAGLYAEASVNGYYTIMGVIGWMMWSRRKDGEVVLHISHASAVDWRNSFLFFAICYGVLWWILSRFTNSTVPEADAFASATAYTGMWLMNKKKVESWIWWIVTDLASIPLYFSKGFVFTSVQYLVFLGLAVAGLVEWRKKLRKAAV